MKNANISPKAHGFFFPYEGGHVYSYESLQQKLMHQGKVSGSTTFELPGHGKRIWEELTHSGSEQIARTLPLITRHAQESETPFFFFGAGLGAWTAFHMACELQRQAQALPVRLFLLQCPFFSLPSRQTLMEEESVLSSFIKRRSPLDLPLSTEFRPLLLPLLRADLLLQMEYEEKMQNDPTFLTNTYRGQASFFHFLAPELSVSSVLYWQKYFATPASQFFLSGPLSPTMSNFPTNHEDILSEQMSKVL